MASPTHGHEFEQALGVGNGQGRLGYLCPWGLKTLDITATELNFPGQLVYFCIKFI